MANYKQNQIHVTEIKVFRRKCIIVENVIWHKKGRKPRILVNKCVGCTTYSSRVRPKHEVGCCRTTMRIFEEFGKEFGLVGMCMKRFPDEPIGKQYERRNDPRIPKEKKKIDCMTYST